MIDPILVPTLTLQSLYNQDSTLSIKENLLYAFLYGVAVEKGVGNFPQKGKWN